MKRVLRFFFVFFVLCSSFIVYYVYQAGHEEKSKSDCVKKENIYIHTVSGSTIQIFEKGITKTYNIDTKEAHLISPGVADIVISKEHVKKISMKPDTISGKVLLVDQTGLELENYGRIEFAKSFNVYSLVDGIKETDSSNIVVGYSNTRFVVADGKIQSALIDKAEEKENETEHIRVMIMTDNFEGYEHEKVKVTANRAFSIKEKEEVRHYKEGEKVEISPEKYAKVSVEEGGRIKLLSIKRQNIHPSYRGEIEIRKYKTGYHIINELPLEKYLYSVVSSEMPTDYELEALKAQAVCARSYGKSQIKENKLRRFGAHVDDSVSYQVYNNVPEDDKSRQAVKETKGEVVVSNGKIATTYFYSTSCGSSSSSKDVWYTKEISYLTENRTEDLSVEKTFHSFLNQREETCFDRAFPWYRWKTTLTAESIEKQLEANIELRYQANPTYIRIKKGNKYTSGKPNHIGNIKKIHVVRRGKSGIVTTLEIVGSKKTVRIYSEYNIRLLLAGKEAIYQRESGDEVGGLNLLPSAFFTIKKQDGKFYITGGGFGHGVGMSQCGANGMARLEKNYREIIHYYFPTTEVLQDIY